MPSWNIHIAHVERLLSDHQPDDLGIDDVNAFLFGNFIPDIHLGYVVPNPSYRINYCMTHMADPNVIPIPEADRYWDRFVAKRWTETPAELSLLLGAWAHLVADRTYNSRFRLFCKTHDTPHGEELRKRKQSDFDVFGHSLDISMHVQATPKLFEAAKAFRPYSIARKDVERTVDVANGIVRKNATPPTRNDFQLLDPTWMTDAFDACNEELALWLLTWRKLYVPGKRIPASTIRAKAALPPA